MKSISKVKWFDKCVYFRQVVVLFLRSIYRLDTFLSLRLFDSSFNKHNSLSATSPLAQAIPCKSYGCGKPNALMQEGTSTETVALLIYGWYFQNVCTYHYNNMNGIWMDLEHILKNGFDEMNYYTGRQFIPFPFALVHSARFFDLSIQIYSCMSSMLHVKLFAHYHFRWAAVVSVVLFGLGLWGEADLKQIASPSSSAFGIPTGKKQETGSPGRYCIVARC